jgi:flavin reductase (DIM6/NTAB) family NADH-FMN oxidoreductase RutF
MMRSEVAPDYGMKTMLDRLSHPGLLLAASKPSGEVNVMTIGWGTLGIIWGLPIYCVLVRPSRYTYQFIEESQAFSVNVPSDDMFSWVNVCGTRSGRNVDKFGEYDQTYCVSEMADTITLDGAIQVYECRVVHHNDVLPTALDAEVEAGSYGGSDYHRIYYGQIMRVTAEEA